MTEGQPEQTYSKTPVLEEIAAKLEELGFERTERPTETRYDKVCETCIPGVTVTLTGRELRHKDKLLFGTSSYSVPYDTEGEASMKSDLGVDPEAVVAPLPPLVRIVMSDQGFTCKDAETVNLVHSTYQKLFADEEKFGEWIDHEESLKEL